MNGRKKWICGSRMVLGTYSQSRVSLLSSLTTLVDDLHVAYRMRFSEDPCLSRTGFADYVCTNSECAQLNFSRKILKGDNPRNVGQPSDTTKSFILQPSSLTRLAAEQQGELCLAGPQIASGYHNRPEQTDKAFVSNPFGEGKIYRTGDLAVRHSDDSIEILGRIDYQIKVHGQRLEPSEVTMALSKHPGVQSIAVVSATIQGKTSLVAAVVPKEPERWSNLITDLRNQAQRSLPSFMIPNYWLQMDSLLTNANGKADVSGIRHVAEKTDLESLLRDISKPVDDADKPANDMELTVRDVWAKILNMKPTSIGRSVAFTALGGSSLDAIQVVRELRSHRVAVELDDILRARGLSHLRLSNIGDGLNLDAARNPPRFSLLGDSKTREQLQSQQEIDDAYDPTQLQASLVASTLKGSPDYLYQRTYDVRHLDIVKLKLCFQVVFSSSEVLRSTFTNTDAGMLQVVRNNFSLPWEARSTNLEEFKRQDKAKGINFDEAFVRFTVLNNQLLVVSMHHSLFDFWSHNFLYQDVASLYLGLEPIQRPPFRRFLHQLQRQDLGPAKVFWESYLRNSEQSILNQSSSTKTNQQSCQILLDVKSATRTLGCTSGTLIYTAWALLLARHTRHSEAVFATAISGRELPIEDIDCLDGPTLTIVPQRIALDPNLPLREIIQHSHTSFWDLLKHSQYGMRRALYAADAQGSEAFDTLVNFLVKDPKAVQVSEKIFQPYGQRPTWATEWSTLDVEENDAGYSVRLISRMPQRRIKFILDQLATIIRAMVASPDATLESMDILGSEEKEWLSSASYSVSAKPQRLHDRFEAIVQRYPHNVALQWQAESSYTYSELNATANQMAHYLFERAVKVGDKVPLLLDKSPMMIIAILALLKIGAAYVPLSPENPAGRNQFIVQEIQAKLLLTESTHQGCLTENKITSVLVDKIELTKYPDKMPDIEVDPACLAYVIYTSGSTGQPKGVMIEHRSVSAAIGSIMSFEGRENSNFRSLQFSNYVFDVSVYDIFVALSSGHTLCMAPTDRLLSDLGGVINEMKVDHCFLTPTVARLLDPESVPSLKVLTVGGESVTSDVVDKWSDGHRLMNGYGPTETSILATMKEIKPDTNPKNIGTPLATLKAFIIEPDGHRLSPWGAIGELCFSGPQLGDGYLGRPEQTATAFFEYENEGIGRIYRTGDLGRWLPNGDIECLGRIDNQIKINGYRVELGEVEQAFLTAPNVKDAVVSVLESNAKSQLVAFVVLSTVPEREAGTFALQSHPQELDTINESLHSLAHYMIPKYVIALGEMPKLPSGKSNRKELKSRAGSMSAVELSQYSIDSSTQSGPRLAPQSKNEKAVHGAWAQVLGIDGEQFGLEADFLKLGGDSIAAINLASALRKSNLALSVGDALKFTNLKDMTDHVETEDSTGSSEQPFETPQEVERLLADKGLEGDIEYVYSCPPGQAEFVAQGARNEQYWVAMPIRKLAGNTSIDAWLQVAQKLAELNDILRTAFVQHEQTWYGVVLKDTTPRSRIVDITNDDDRAKAIDDVWKMRFESGKVPLSYTFLCYIDNTQELVVKMDHGLYDGTLLRIFDEHFRAIQHDQQIEATTPFHDFAEHLYRVPKSRAQKFWTQPDICPTAFKYPETRNPTITATEILTAPDLKIDHLCKATGSTPSIVFQAAFQLWLSQRTGSDDVAFDYLYTGRNVDLPNPQSINGTCANFLPLRSCISKSDAIGDYLSRTSSAFWKATENGVIPMSEIYHLNGLPREENTNKALFLFQPFDPPAQNKADEDMRWVVMAKSEVTMPQPYGLVFEIVKLVKGWKLKIGYDTSCYDEDGAREVAEEIKAIVGRMVEVSKETLLEEVMEVPTQLPE